MRSAQSVRWLPAVLAAVVVGLTLLAVAAFAVAVVVIDGKLGTARIDAELQGAVKRGEASVGHRGPGEVSFSGLASDPAHRQCPQVAALGGPDQDAGIYRSARPCAPPLDRSVLAELRDDAMRANGIVFAEFDMPDGTPVRTATVPVRAAGSDAPVGAIVAWSDLTAERDRHAGVTWLVAGVGSFVAVLVGLVVMLVLRRLLRPAATAVGLQESILSDAAHDLRTPIAALRALGEAARDNPEERAAILPRVVTLATRMSDVMDDLLARARLAAGVEDLQRLPARLDQLVESAIDDLPPGEHEVRLTAAPAVVQADSALLRRALVNLLTNAVQHGHRPGETAVVRVSVTGGLVTIADEGPGISQEAIDAVFGGPRSASGYGLPVARWIVQAHGGTLAVYNAADGGAIVELELPVSDGR